MNLFEESESCRVEKPSQKLEPDSEWVESRNKAIVKSKKKVEKLH